MLRLLILLLLLANATYLAWSQHWLADLLGRPARQHEPCAANQPRTGDPARQRPHPGGTTHTATLTWAVSLAAATQSPLHRNPPQQQRTAPCNGPSEELAWPLPPSPHHHPRH